MKMNEKRTFIKDICDRTNKKRQKCLEKGKKIYCFSFLIVSSLWRMKKRIIIKKSILYHSCLTLITRSYEKGKWYLEKFVLVCDLFCVLLFYELNYHNIVGSSNSKIKIIRKIHLTITSVFDEKHWKRALSRRVLSEEFQWA